MEEVALTYAEMHLYFTIPITFVLWLIARPFLDGAIKGGIIFLCTLAVAYTTPWDHFLIVTETWSYSNNKVIATLWDIPIEEYFFFGIQTVMVSLWAFLCLRWSIPTVHFGEDSPIKANIIRWTPVPFIIYISMIAWTNLGAPLNPYFYMSCILGWAVPMIGFLWIGSGNYIVKRFIPTTIAIIVPTLYLWYVDLIALRKGVWTINPASIIGIYVYDVLPLEEAIFFLIVNIMIVFGICAIQKSFAILHSFPELFQDIGFLLNLFRALFMIESSLPQERIKDLRKTIQVLRNGSKSFWPASFIFPSDTRQDLSILYAFCRVTDDIADDNVLTTEQKLTKLKIIREFLDQLFEDRNRKGDWIYGLNKKKERQNSIKINWKYFQNVLSEPELVAFRSLSRIAHYLPAEPFYELCKGYEFDITGQTVETKEDLVKYSEYVAGSVGVLCTYVMCKGTQGWFGSFSGHMILEGNYDREIVKAVRHMGVCLQLINISRDIVTDSETLGRCYIPLEFLNPDKKEKLFQLLTSSRDPWSLGEDEIRKLSLRVISLAEEFKLKGQQGISMLPDVARKPVVCVADIYTIKGNIIKENPGFLKRASARISTKIGILIKSMYLPSDATCYSQ